MSSSKLDGVMSKIVYEGNLRTRATHLRSGNVIVTDAPVDNKGKGEAFSPTDLCATALASCVLTIMGIAAAERGIDLSGANATVVKVMGGPPRMISVINIEIDLSAKPYTATEKRVLAKAAKSCPVGRSLSSDLKQEIRLLWQD